MGNIFVVSCIIAGCFAPANVNIANAVLAQPKIEQTQIVARGDELFVGIITQPLFTLSEKQKLVESIATDIKQKFSYTNVIVSTNCDLFHKAKKINSQPIANPVDIENLFLLAKAR
ncbi:MAG: YhcN/YlaJ family sporulation lipoprotein [Clostridia bacterium]